MRTLYSDLDIQLTLDYTTFHILNIVFEQFQKSMPKHSHGTNSYEIHYIPSGYGKVNIDNKIYDIIPNTLYMTGPHIEHEQIPLLSDPMVEYCVYFTLQTTSLPQISKHHTVSSIFQSTPFWFGQDSQNLHPILEQIFNEFEHKYTGYMTQIESLLQQCIVKIVRNYETKKELNTSYPAINLVDSKYIVAEESFLYDYEVLTLEILAKRLGLGIRQTERFIKKYYGKTFSQKKIEAKMSAAKIHLKDPEISISEVANRLNYSSIEHFSYAFKHYYGISPSAYRKKHL